MNKTIAIGSVHIPLNDFVVARTGILGITRSGKTYTAKGIAEQLLDHDIPIVVFDAIGVWRFIKVAGEGSHGRGYKVVVAGGKKPDLPLTAAGAPEIVRAAIRENIPLILDLYDPKLSKADWRRIVQDSFRILLYENKGLRHIFLEEAAEYAPQKVMDGQTYAEVEKLGRMGGNVGLGITFINQRAQELNKAVLELCDNLILLRQRGSHAIEALEKWLDKVSPDTAAEIAKSLPHMSQGDCWVWSEDSEQPIRTRSKELRSLHPDRRMPEQALASRKMVDTEEFVSKLSGELGKLIEEQKANDPAALKREIAALKKQLADGERSKPVTKSEIKKVEIPVVKDGQLSRMEVIVGRAEGSAEAIKKCCETVLQQMKQIQHAPAPTATPITRSPAAPLPRVRQPSSTHSNGDVGKGGLRRILVALANRPHGLSVRQIGVRAGLSSKSGSFGTYMSTARSHGWIDGQADRIRITEDGLQALGEYEQLPTGPALLNHWLHHLGESGAARILRAVAAAYPNAVSKEEIATTANLSPSSGSFGTYLSTLRSLELIEGRGELRASKELFE